MGNRISEILDVILEKFDGIKDKFTEFLCKEVLNRVFKEKELDELTELINELMNKENVNKLMNEEKVLIHIPGKEEEYEITIKKRRQ